MNNKKKARVTSTAHMMRGNKKVAKAIEPLILEKEPFIIFFSNHDTGNLGMFVNGMTAEHAIETLRIAYQGVAGGVEGLEKELEKTKGMDS